MDHLTVPVTGGDLFVARWGSGPPVLAVYGITGSHAAWPWVADRLVGAVSLIAPDLRGRGASNGLPGLFGMAAHAADLVAVLDHLDAGVDLQDRTLGRRDLVGVDVGGAVDDLALQVGGVDHVVVDQADGADPCGGEVERQRRPEPAGAHQQHLGGLEPLLSLHPDVGDDQVAAVARDLVVGQRFAPVDHGR